MALDNAEVLENLTKQLSQVQEQLEVGRATALRLQGAIEVLQQIEGSKVEEEPSDEEAPVDGGEVEESSEGQEG
tara:strand:+ start:72 stop:293 length:222 start_codon:yes stop_codon:yes gene_type:complete